jgi:hypothetical protein
MFWFIVDILTLRRLGLGKPFRYALLVLILGCLGAALIYTYVFFNAVRERNHASHGHAHSTR